MLQEHGLREEALGDRWKYVGHEDERSNMNDVNNEDHPGGGGRIQAPEDKQVNLQVTRGRRAGRSINRNIRLHGISGRTWGGRKTWGNNIRITGMGTDIG